MPCIGNLAPGPGGLEYPIQIRNLETFLDNRGKNIPASLGSRQEMQRHPCDAPAARQTLERSVQPGDVNVAFEEQHRIHYGQDKGREDVSKLSEPQHRERNPTNSIHLCQTETAITACSLLRKL